MNIPSGYDPVTLNHWLWFKCKCHEASPLEFQSLFENILKRAYPKFQSIEPYGNLGDRKTDGLLFVDGIVFQVYSPKEFRLNDLKNKINDDLAGAVKFWGKDLKSWVFVYNASGIPADIPKLLSEKGSEYPDIVFDHLHCDGLWEIARNELSLQQRAEILGAPVGYEYLFFAYHKSSEELTDIIDKAWFVVIQDLMSPVNLSAVVEALSPDIPIGAPFYIHPPLEEIGWKEAAQYQREAVKDLLSKSWDVLPRYAVFSLAPIPLAIHLGFLLSDRVEVRCFQHDRDNYTWKWSQTNSDEADLKFTIRGLPQQVSKDNEIAIRVSLSAKIEQHQTLNVISEITRFIDLEVKNPNIMWLCSPEQLRALRRTFRNILQNIRTYLPECKKIHLFYAGPTGGAIVIGQEINPRMNPPTVLYQFSQQNNPPYTAVLTLIEDNF